MTVQKDMYKL